MSASPSLRRLALLLALLPQLLVLGLGQGIVVCIAPGGHLQVEVVASGCCDGPTAAATRTDGELAGSSEEPDCGSCSDFRIALDSRVTRSSRDGRPELTPDSTAALPVQVSTLPIAGVSPPWLGRPLDRGPAPPHLLRLRSVLLRC